MDRAKTTVSICRPQLYHAKRDIPASGSTKSEVIAEVHVSYISISKISTK
jgi:hypothetical protein